MTCDALGGDLSVEDVGSATPSITFRYDPSADQYIYNADFRDKPVGTCWKLRATLDSGQVLDSAIFRLRK